MTDPERTHARLRTHPHARQYYIGPRGNGQVRQSDYASIPIDHDRLGPGRVVEPMHVRRAKWLTVLMFAAVIAASAWGMWPR